MEVARATSPPMRSSMRRSTPAMGDGVQARLAAWTTARREKSALSSMAIRLLSGVCGAGALGDVVAPSRQPHEVTGWSVDGDELDRVGQPFLGKRDADAGGIGKVFIAMDLRHGPSFFLRLFLPTSW